MSMFWIYYIICFVYCFYKNYKGTEKRSYDGVIGSTPGFDVLIILLLCWLLGPVDLIVSVYSQFNIKIQKVENSDIQVNSDESVTIKDVKDSSIKIETK